jgi:hypothetical protein
LTAVAIDDDSLSRTSAAVNVTVRTPHAPSGAITEPANAATLVVGWPIHLAANASDPDRTVAEVRFFANGFLIGSDPAPPFQANWSPVAGSYALTAVVVDDDALAATSTVVNVTIATTEGGPRSFRETGGLVVMEAEQFDTNTLAAGHVWVPTNSIAGFVGDSVMQALPNNGATITANIQTGSPALAFRVDFTTPGTYKFWIRGWGAAGSDDSVHLGVDGQLPQTLNYGTSGAWTWRAGQVSIAGPGLHHINLWMREDGAYVDRLLLTTNLAFTPSGGGPIESPRIGGGTKLPPHVVFTTPTDGGVFLAGAPIPITVEASDFDGAVSRVEFFRNGISMGVDTNAPYGTSFAPLTGDYVLTAVATDSDSITTTSTVVFVTIGPPPVVLPALECFVAGGQLTLTYEIPPELKYFDLALKKSSNAVGWTSGDNFFQTSNRTQNANGSERITRRMQLNQLTAPSMYFRLATPP